MVSWAELLRASMRSALTGQSRFARLITKLPGASFEHHAMHDGLQGEPQGCGE